MNNLWTVDSVPLSGQDNKGDMMRVQLNTLKTYAAGKSPIIGIPHTPGSAPTAVRREHLLVALSCPHVTKASIDAETGDLTVNGSRKAHYTLFNLNRTTSRFEIQRLIRVWSEAKAKTLQGKELYGKLSAKAQKIETHIRAIQKKIDRTYFKPNELPDYFFNARITTAKRESDVYHDQYRASDYENEKQWSDGRAIRIALAHITGERIAGRPSHSKRETWGDFYARIGQVLGHPIDASKQHGRVCNLKGGPERIDYLKQIYKYVTHIHKPYNRDHSFVSDWNMIGSEDYRDARKEYINRRREYRALASELENCRELLKAYQTENAAAEVIERPTDRGE